MVQEAMRSFASVWRRPAANRAPRAAIGALAIFAMIGGFSTARAQDDWEVVKKPPTPPAALARKATAPPLHLLPNRAG